MTNDAKINVSSTDENTDVQNTENQQNAEVCYDITQDGTVIIGTPVSGVEQAIEADAGQNYIFNVSPDSITSAEQSGNNLVVTFDNGSVVTLTDYITEIAQGAEPSLTFMNGQVVTLAALSQDDMPEEELEDPQSEVREDVADSGETGETGEGQVNIAEASTEELNEIAEELAETEPAAGEDVAQALANIEPAAGEGAGAAGSSGYGFESSFEAQGVIPLEDIGPINPTALRYAIPEGEENLFIEEELPALNPEFDVQDAQILEDGPNGPVTIDLTAIPETSEGVLTITIGNIPNTWTVTGPGTYNPATETWSITTRPGQTFIGGPELSPPADSDVDLIGLPVTVTETNAQTGQSGTTTGSVDVIVDAVADQPDVDGNNATGNEGDTLDIDIPVALTGEEVNNGISGDDGSESIVNIVISPVDPNVDLNDYTITNVNGPVTLDANGNIVFTDRSELQDLQITPNDPDYNGSIDLNITLNTRDNPTDTDFDTTNNTAQDADVITLTWLPTANPPTVEVDTRNAASVDDAYVYEDNTAVVDVTGTLDPNGSGNEILTLTVTGIDLTKLEGGAAGFTPSNGPNGEVWTRVAGSSDDNASYEITLAPNTNYVGTFSFDPLDQSDLDITGMSVTATSLEPASNTTASSGPDDFNVIVDAVADPVDIQVQDDSGNEGTTLDIEISNAITGEQIIANQPGADANDGSEQVVNIIIAPQNGVDLQNDFTVTNTNGTVSYDANGNIVFTDMSDLNGLQITPNDPDYNGSVQLEVTFNTTERPISDTDFDDTNDFAQDVEVINLTWKPTANPPTVEVDTRNAASVDDAYVYEDNTAVVDVTGTLDPNGSGNEILTLTVTGIDLTKLEGGAAGFTPSNGPNGEVWTRVAGSPDDNASYEITLAPNTNYVGTFSFDPLDQGDLDITGMSVTATSLEPASNTTASSGPDDFNVIVDAVADPVDIQVQDDSGNEGTTLDIVVGNAITGEQIIANQPGTDANDGSERVESIVIEAQNGVDFNDFTITNANGTVTPDANGNIVFSDASGLNGLQITPKDSQYSGSVDLKVTFTTTERPISDTDFDDTNDFAQDVETLTLTWNPVINPPSVKVNNGIDDAQVKEDFSVDVPVEASLDPNAGSAEYLTLTLTGVDLTRLEGGEAGFNATDSTSGASWTRVAGSPDNDASYTITLTAGENYTGTFSFDPLDQSDLDISGMNVQATSTDPSVDPVLTASSNDDFNVIVDAVADKPDVDAKDNSGEEGDSLAVDIDGMLGVDDFDGSEEITGYEVSGDPLEMAGFTFTVNGVVRTPVNGTISLAPSEVDALVVTPKDGTFVGDLELDAKILTRDVPNDDEFDTSDNTNSDSDPFTLTWNDDDEPQFADETVSVDETNFTGTPRSTSVSEKIDVDFGDDGAGATIQGNGQFDLGGATSRGDAITVNYDTATSMYVGEAGGRAVFTLDIENNGDYTFTLLDQIDHNIDGDNSNGEYNDSLPFEFGFTATDSDGDAANGTITVNVFDDGLTANDDCAEFNVTATQKDYNIALVLDVSGSMQGDKIDLLKSSVSNLLQDFNGYQGGEIKVHLVPFSGSDQPSATFTVTNAAEYNAAINFLNALNANGTTNYEAPLQSAINWLQGGTANDPISGADTYTYFVSDGAPNRYVNNNGGSSSSDADRAMDEITGVTDNTDEVSLLQSLNTEVISVGIGVNSTTLARLGIIDSDGQAIDVQDPNDLDAAFQNSNPITGSVSGNVITGENGGPGAADDVGEDFVSTVTAISFNGNTVAVNSGSSTTINGDNGVLTINADGSYTYRLSGNAQAVNGQITDQFEYTLTDGDGDFDTALLIVKGNADDQPLNVTTENLTVDETDIVEENPVGEDTDSGTVTADFGLNGPGSFEVGNASNVTFTGAENNTLTSAGEAVTITTVGNKYVGSTSTETIFELEIQSNGSYEFTLLGDLDHADPNNPDDIIKMNFEVIAKDNDGDTATGTITVDVVDDAPIAYDDFNKFDADASNTTNGNVVTGLNGGPNAEDNLSEDDVDPNSPIQNYVSEVNGVAISTTGTTTVDGQYGTLEIAADGSYTYTLNPGVQSETTYSYSINNPPGSDAAGDIKNVETSYNADTNLFTFSTVVEPSANGFTVAVNNGPNPKGSDGLTLFYFDNSTGTPVVTAYSYNGQNTQTSWNKGPNGGAAVDQISSINTPDAFQNISVTTDANGNMVYSFALDSSNVNASFGDEVGIWLHPVSGLQTNYGSDGYLDQWSIAKQSYYDVAHKDTTVTEVDCVTDEFNYTLVDGDGDASDAVLTIKADNLKDDGPMEITTENLLVDETDIDEIPSGEDTDSGTVTANFGADGPGTFETGNPANVTFNSAKDGKLTSNGDEVNITVSGNKYIGATATETIFELEIQQNGNYEFTLLGQLDHADANDPDDAITMNFEVIAVDADSDTSIGQIRVDVKDDGPIARDDYNHFNKATGEATGNVITGENGGPDAADNLSQDAVNKITKISFGNNEVDVPTSGFAEIDGDNGTLKIFADGSYEYTATKSSSTTTAPGSSITFDPVQSDANGQQESLSKNGITVSVSNSGDYDITWVNTADGSGLGIDNLNRNDSQKIFPSGEGFNIGFDGQADAVTLTISELGNNNDDGQNGCELTLTLADGSTVMTEVQFDPAKIVNGHMDITLDSADYGQLITGVHLTTLGSGQYNATSMLLNNVTVDYPGEEITCAEDQFTYTLTDADGDSSTALLDIECYTSELRVGQNVDDTPNSNVQHLVGGEEGAILGAAGEDILIGDAGGSATIEQTKDYNVLFVLDISGSMSEDSAPTRLEILQDSLTTMMNDFANYQDGQVKVHFSTFSSNAGPSGTFTLTNGAQLSAALAYLNNLNAGGSTNYEAGLQSGLEWLKGNTSDDPLDTANTETISYFITDGEPKGYINDNGQYINTERNGQAPDYATINAELDGTRDGTNEIGDLHALSTKVYSVGIEIGQSDNIRPGDSIEIRKDNIRYIAEDPNDPNNTDKGEAIFVENVNDLSLVLQGASPITRLSSVGDDQIEGGDRGDLIFGDALNTDDLASSEGLNTDEGAGWEVFERLENGEGNTSGWTREDTVEFIRNNAEALAEEVVNSQGGRSGGNDTLRGGAGDDIIFGQEGDDIISGGEGNDVLYGGSGKDTFLFESIDDGTDTIKDFEVGSDVLDFSGLISGYSSLQDAINDFVFDVKQENGNTTVSVDADGQGGSANAVPLVVLEGVSADLDDLSGSGNGGIIV